jgi:predicted transcriptional regulator
MTITIRLSDEEQRRLAERAARSGRDLADYVHLLIKRDIQQMAGVEQALAPFRRQVEESGLTDDELGDFFEDVRAEVWQDKHGRPSQPSLRGPSSTASSFCKQRRDSPVPRRNAYRPCGTAAPSFSSAPAFLLKSGTS